MAADRLDLPVAWLVGPMVVSLGLAVAGREVSVPPGLQRLAQATIGVNAAAGLHPDVLRQMRDLWLAALGSVLVTLGLGVAAGLSLAGVARVQRRTAILGFIPGGASGIVAVSSEMGADAPAVAIVQYVRLMTTTLSAPLLVLLARHLDPATAATRTVPFPVAAVVATGGESATVWPFDAGVAVTLATVAAGLALATRWRIPAAPVILPMLVAAFVNAAGLPHRPLPRWATDAAMAVLGTWVGMRFRRRELNRHVALAGWAALLSLGLLIASLGVGLALHRLTGVSALASILATAPGALEGMTATALATGAEPGLVLSFHVMRMAASLALGPALASSLADDARRWPASLNKRERRSDGRS